jgi:hypothetical protein
MARFVFGSYLVRYPLGGMMSHVLQYLVGLRRLGHEVTFVERADYPDACFDPSTGTVSDDCRYGVAAAAALLGRYGMGGDWCFVDAAGTYHGLDRAEVGRRFAAADAFIDMGTHGAWLPEAQSSGRRVLIDGEPGYNQIRMSQGLLDPTVAYDVYVTNGLDVGTPASAAPTAGRHWHHVFHPVVADLFTATPAPSGASFTTVMNWQSHEPIEHRDRRYGQKDVEFERFMPLPSRVADSMEIAVAGPKVPRDRLAAAGWTIRDAHEVTSTYDAFVDHVVGSAGEFSVCKEVFVALRTGWFSDRSAVFLACGRPVVVQDTGWSAHLPTGRGLFAIRDVDEAAEAVAQVRADWDLHARAAREIALEHLDAVVVLRRLLDSI